MAVRMKVWFELDGAFVIGQGGAEVLVAIESTGSLARAAAQVGWSYRHAWGYLRRAEGVLGRPLTTPRSGKGSSRGMRLTAEARQLLARFRSAQALTQLRAQVPDEQEQRIAVFDSGGYSEANMKSYNQASIWWISRVPETSAAAKTALQ